MTIPNTPTGILRDAVLVLPKGRVWGVRDYHTTLEQRAIAGAAMNWGYVAMTVAAAVMATAGLLLNSPAIVIGSMCVAPFIAPSRAVCIGALFRQSHVLFGGLVKQLIGMLVISVSVASIITAVLHHTTTGITITPEILLRAMPTTRDGHCGGHPSADARCHSTVIGSVLSCMPPLFAHRLIRNISY
jgi:hypothetical protein